MAFDLKTATPVEPPKPVFDLSSAVPAEDLQQETPPAVGATPQVDSGMPLPPQGATPPTVEPAPLVGGWQDVGAPTGASAVPPGFEVPDAQRSDAVGRAARAQRRAQRQAAREAPLTTAIFRPQPVSRAPTVENPLAAPGTMPPANIATESALSRQMIAETAPTFSPPETELLAVDAQQQARQRAAAPIVPTTDPIAEGMAGDITRRRYGVADAATGLVNEPRIAAGKVGSAALRAGGDAFGNTLLAGAGERLGKRYKAEEENLTPQYESALLNDVYGGLKSTVDTLAVVALTGFAGRGMAAGMAGKEALAALPGAGLAAQTATVVGGLSGLTAADSYHKYRDRGASPLLAGFGSLGDGAIEALTEAMPMSFLVKKLGKAGATEFIAGFLGREMATEQIATAAQDAVDTAIANPDKTWGDYLRERPSAALSTAVAVATQTAVMGGLNAVARAASKEGRLDREQAAALEALLAKIRRDQSPPASPLGAPPGAAADAAVPAHELLGRVEPPVGAPPSGGAPTPSPAAEPATGQPAQPATPIRVTIGDKTHDIEPPAAVAAEADRVRAAGIDLKDWLGQGDVLGRDLHPETVEILARLDEVGRDPALARIFNEAMGVPDEGQGQPAAEAVQAAAVNDAGPVQAGPEAGQATGPAGAPVGSAGEGQAVGGQGAAQAGQEQEGGVGQHPRDAARREERGREDRELPPAQPQEGAAGRRGSGLPQGGPVQPEGVANVRQPTAGPGASEPASSRSPVAAAADRAADGDATDGRAPAGDAAVGGAVRDVTVDDRGRELTTATVAGKDVTVHTNPTEAQKAAGNYRKDPVWVDGLRIRVENPAGSTRRGTDRDGKQWESTLAHDYGYIVETSNGTPQNGRDKDKIDVFLGPGGNTYVIDQKNPRTGMFDEHKVMHGFPSQEAAVTAYLSNYPKGWKGVQAVTEVGLDDLKDWLHNGDTTKRFAKQKLGADLEGEFAKLHRALRTVIGERRMAPLYKRLEKIAGPVRGGKITAEQLRKGLVEMKAFIREIGQGPALLKEAATAVPANAPAFRRAETGNNRGINIEVAPNPDNRPLTERFDGLSEQGKRRATAVVGNEIIPLVLADMGIKGEVEHTIGGFEGKTNPSIIVRFAPDVSFEEMAEAAKALGYVFSQKAVITYDTKDKTGNQTGFVRVYADNDLSYEQQHDIFAEVVKHFPQAGGFTGHEGAMVFGNYTAYDPVPLTDEQYRERLEEALAKVQYDLMTEADSWRSEYDDSQSLAGTRYGQGDKDAAGGKAGAVAAGAGRLDGFRAQAQQALEAALPDAASFNRGLSQTERAVSSEGLLYGNESLPLLEKAKVYTVARALERRAQALGLDLTGTDDQTRDTIARIIAHEVALAVKKDPEAIGWYRHRLENTIKLASLVYPEIGEVDDARFAFTLALAITSNGQAIAKNVDYAFYVYSRYRERGVFPTNLDVGERSDQINGAFAQVNRLIKDNDFDGAKHFLTSKLPAKALIDMGWTLRELVSETVYGGTVLGPKIGGAFLQNLNGNYDALTMDRWLMRTWGRIIGKLTFHGTERQANAAAYLREQMKKKGIKGNLTEVAEALYAKAEERGFKNMTVIEKAARRYLSAGMRDAPESGAQRSFIRKVFTAAGELLKDKHAVTIADMQAILWYAEKDLYEKLGVVNKKAVKTDYERETAEYIRQRGVPDEQIAAVLQPAGRRGRRGAASADQRGDEAAPFNRGPQAVRAGDAGTAGRTGEEDEPLTFSRRPVQPGAVSVVAVHYGRQPGLDELSSDKYGTGSRGAEFDLVRRDPRLSKRVYFYEQTTDRLPAKEAVVLGRHPYRVRLTNVLDLRSDAGKAVIAAAKRTPAGGVDYVSFERAVIDAGYDGYISRNLPGFESNPIVLLDVGNVPVDEVRPEPAIFRRSDTPVSSNIADMDVPGGEPRKYDDEFTRFERAAWVLAQMARDESFFNFPVSKATTLAGVAKDFDPGITVEKYPASSKDLVAVYEVSIPPAAEGQSPSRFMLRQTKSGAIHANLASMRSGRGAGAMAYQITAEWARNAKLRFEGDPDGLEPIAHARRAEAMISSFLKSGTTAHMEPHEYMIEDGFMDDADAIDPTQALKKWRKLDDLTKLALTIRYAYGKLIAHAPADLGDVRYDFEKARFYHIWDSDKTLGPAWFDDLAKKPGLRPIGGGSRSLRRAAIVNTVLLAQDREAWSRILAGVRAWQDGGNPRALAGLAYSRGRAAPERFPAADARRLIAAVTKRWKGGPKVVLHETLATAEQALKDAGYDMTRPYNRVDDSVKGILIDDEMHLLLPNFESQRDVLETLAHEAVGHYGVRALVGEQEWARILKDIQSLRATGNKAINRLWDSVVETHGNLKADAMANEVIARAAEEGIDADGNYRPGFAWLKRVFAAVAQWLREHGFNVRFSNIELQGILSQSQRNIERGETSLGAAGERSAPQNRGHREGSKTERIAEALSRQMWAIAREKRVDDFGRAKFEAMPKPKQMELRRAWRAEFDQTAPSEEAFHQAVWRWRYDHRGQEIDDSTMFRLWNEAKAPASFNRSERDVARDADLIAAMSDEKRDNTELGDFPGTSTAYNLYEARKLVPKPSDKLKRVTDRNSFSLWQDYDYVANIDGEHYGISLDDDPDNPDGQDEAKDKKVFSYIRLVNAYAGSPTATIIDSKDVAGLIEDIRSGRGAASFNRGTRNGALPRVGLLDAALRMPGKHVARFITQPLWARVSALVERIVPEKVKHGLVSDYGLPEPYLDAKMERQANINQLLRKTHNLINQIQALDRQQARVAYLWMTKSPDLDAESEIMAELPAESRATLVEMKQAVDAMGREAVALGMLEQEVYERNKLAYLHRSFVKYESDLTAQQKALRQRSIAIRGDQFKGRGLRDDITKGDLEYESTPFAKGNTYMRLEKRDPPPADAPEGAKGKLRRVIYWPAGRPVPPMYRDFRNDGLWEARWVNGDKVGMWRDFNADELARMGQIDEVRYAFGKTMLQAVRDVETARFLKWAADNYAVADEAAVAARGGKVVAGVDKRGSVQTFALDEWVEVPSIKIPGTNVKRYGALAGKYIPGVMFNDLRQTMNLHLNLGETWEKILRAWKISKTGLSPAVHMNNVMSNFVMADMADVRARDLFRALKTIVAAKRGDEDAKRMVERFADSGGDLGNFAHMELGQEIEKILTKELEDEVNATSDSVGAVVRMGQVMDLLFHGQVRSALAQAQMTKPIRATMWPFRTMIEAYGQEDTAFRLAKFLKELEEGATDREAGKAARDAFLNYEINAPWIQAVRRTALPFVAFSYRAIPLLAKTAANKPWKFAKYLAVGGGLNALAYAMLGLGGDDEDKERRLLPDELSGRTLGIFPRLLRMPWNDEHGSPVFLDVRRWVPAGDIFETQKNAALPLPSWLTLGGPLTMVAELATNRSTFTGKDIVNKSDTVTEKTAKLLDYQFKFWMPNLPLPNPVGLAGEALVPGIPVGWLQTYSTTNIMAALKGKTDSFGRERTLGNELLNSVGVKLRPYPPDQLLLNERRRTEREVQDINYEIGQLRRQYQMKGLSDEEFDKAMRYQQEKKTDRLTRFREKAGLAE